MAGVFGLVLGVVVGFVFVLINGSFGDAFLPTMLGFAIGGMVLAAVFPAPFLFVLEVLLGILGDIF